VQELSQVTRAQNAPLFPSRADAAARHHDGIGTILEAALRAAGHGRTRRHCGAAIEGPWLTGFRRRLYNRIRLARSCWTKQRREAAREGGPQGEKFRLSGDNLLQRQ